MNVHVTDTVDSITKRIVSGASNVKEKALKIYDYVRELPYDVFGNIGSNIDDLFTSGSPLTCYGKAIAHASMLEAAGIPWRIELSKCSAASLKKTIEAVSEKNPLVMKAFNMFPGLFNGKEMVHATVQANVDGNWKRMDSTIPHEVCSKIKDAEKREKCLSFDNVSAMHDCNTLGNVKSIPEKLITSWNAVSRAGQWANAMLKERKRDRQV